MKKCHHLRGQPCSKDISTRMAQPRISKMMGMSKISITDHRKQQPRQAKTQWPNCYAPTEGLILVELIAHEQERRPSRRTRLNIQLPQLKRGEKRQRSSKVNREHITTGIWRQPRTALQGTSSALFTIAKPGVYSKERRADVRLLVALRFIFSLKQCQTGPLLYKSGCQSKRVLKHYFSSPSYEQKNILRSPKFVVLTISNEIFALVGHGSKVLAKHCNKVFTCQENLHCWLQTISTFTSHLC